MSTRARQNADNWAADITGVTAGTGITGGGTSGTVTVTNSLLTTIDAAGDLLYGTGSDAATRLAIGTAGQVLTVNSGATAPQWATAASATPNFTLLSTTTLSGTTTTISNIPARRTLQVIVREATVSNVFNSRLRLRLNGDSGTNYRYAFSRITAPAIYAATQFHSLSFDGDFFELGQTNNLTVGQVNCGFTIGAADTTGGKPFISVGGGSQTTTGADINNQQIVSGSGIYLGTSAISSMSFSWANSASSNGGTVFIYGSVD